MKKLLNKLKNFILAKRVHVPVVMQMELIECGAASLAMVLAYYKRFVPLEILRDECGCSRDGSTASSILKVARQYNMKAKGIKELSLDGLRKYRFPLILFWNFNHFLVYTGRVGDKHYLNDPAFGERVVSTEEMDQSFSGILLEISPDENFKPAGKPRSFASLVLSRFLQYRYAMFFSILTGILLVPANILTPALSSIWIDKFMSAKNYNWGPPLLIVALITGVFIVILNMMQQNCLIRFNLKLSLTSSFKFFQHLLHLPIHFFSMRQPGELAIRIGMLDHVANFISQQFAGHLLSFLTLIFYAYVLLYYDLMLGLFACGSSLIIMLLLSREIKKRRAMSMAVQQESGRLSGLSASGIMLMETLKATGGEDDFYATWSGMQTSTVMARQKLEVSSLFMNIFPSALMSLNTVCILVLGTIKVLSGSMSMGEFLAFQLMANYLFVPISSLVGMISSLQELDATMNRLDDVLAYKAEESLEQMDKQAHNEHVSRLRGMLELKGVSYGYNPLKDPIIKNLSLKISPGERVAIVGASGSGKSTIAKLIVGLYTPWSGNITFDGKERQEYNSTLFANSFAVVDQEIFLFKGSIYENLSMRNTAISVQSVQDATVDAEIYDEISRRPSGLFSDVEEYGKNFSGGQCQRLEIARALATKPSVLVLDEATSALDPATELRVDHNIRKRGCTTIIIAHRLSTIRDADRIIVMHQGQIVEQGKHDELIAKDAYYSKLVRSM